MSSEMSKWGRELMQATQTSPRRTVRGNQRIEARRVFLPNRQSCNGFIGGPDRDRTDDLFHAMERCKNISY